MNLKKSFTKKISFLVIIAIIAINFSFFAVPKKANAGIEDWPLMAWNNIQTTINTFWANFGKYSFESVMSGITHQLGLQLVRAITDETVSWINSGFQGQPAFIADPGTLLSKSANQTIGNMLYNDPSLNFLCSPFKFQVKIALGLNFGAYKPFKSSISCTLTSVINNVGNSINGWDDWISMTQNPQNNPIGAYLLANQVILSSLFRNMDEFLNNAKDYL